MNPRTVTDAPGAPVGVRQPVAVSLPEPVRAQPPSRWSPARTDPNRVWSNSAFWVLQLVVLALYLVRLAALVSFNLDTTSLEVEFSTLALFVVPVVYAALHYGLRGGSFTAAWVSLLAVPRVVGYARAHEYPAAWAELLQIGLLDALAILIGQGVSAERHARYLAESAREAHLNAEALYRELFDTNHSPILFVDVGGDVVEANAAAQRAFLPAGENRSGAALRPVRLMDMIGPDAAAQVLTGLIAARRPGAGGTREGGDRIEPVPFEVDGEIVLYRLAVTRLGRSETDRRMQVVFEDVTTETRRHDLMEAYAARVVLGQEEERRHLAQELHDGPVQSLIHLCRQIDLLSARSRIEEESPSVTQLRPLVEQAVAELRNIAQGLRPSILDDLGLVASINQLVTQAGARGGFETSFGVTGPERRLAPAVELALFRITQEALSNVERHAGAHRVAVGLDFESAELRLLITDDGAGFDASAGRSKEATGSFGLPGMTERAHLIGARLAVHSAPGGGTTVDVRFPATTVR